MPTIEIAYSSSGSSFSVIGNQSNETLFGNYCLLTNSFRAAEALKRAKDAVNEYYAKKVTKPMAIEYLDNEACLLFGREILGKANEDLPRVLLVLDAINDNTKLRWHHKGREKDARSWTFGGLLTCKQVIVEQLNPNLWSILQPEDKPIYHDGSFETLIEQLMIFSRQEKNCPHSAKVAAAFMGRSKMIPDRLETTFQELNYLAQMEVPAA